MTAVLSGTICMNPSAGDWEVSTMPKTQISNAGGDQHGTKYDICSSKNAKLLLNLILP